MKHTSTELEEPDHKGCPHQEGMNIEYCEWLDNLTFVCNFGHHVDQEGDWFELVGEYQKDTNKFIFERVYDDQVLPVRLDSTRRLMQTAMELRLKDSD